MCGIAGQCTQGYPVSETSIARLSAGIKKRGPDGNGCWLSPAKDVALVHFRLAIIDLSSRGQQPMTTPDGRFTISYNGEIYNFKSLRMELAETGMEFCSDCDTEVVLRLWARDGLEGLGRLEGMYAFAVWDALCRRLTLVRDPLGIKPLYYRHGAGDIMFASQARILAETGGNSRPSAIGMREFLGWGSISPPHTLWHGVMALEPGSAVEWDAATGELRNFRYCDFRSIFAKSPGVLNPDDALGHVRETLRHSIMAHQVSDVPVGVFLSGGIDSTAIVSMLRRQGQDSIQTFSLVCDDAALDEETYAQQAATAYDTEHAAWKVDASVFDEYMGDFLEDMDLPTIDGFNTWLVSRFAARNGLKVAMSGAGSDEIFGGYNSTFRYYPRLLKRLARFPAWTRSWSSAVCRSMVSLVGWHGRLRKMQQLLLAPDLDHAYPVFRMLFTGPEMGRLLIDPDLVVDEQRYPGRVGEALPKAAEASDWRQIRVWEIQSYLMSQLLVDADTFSMCHGLELRVPFVDKTLWEGLAQVAPPLMGNARLPKALLIKAVGDMPPALYERRKGTFTLPFADWLMRCGLIRLLDRFAKKPWRNFLVESEVRLLDSAFRAGRVHWSRCWCLVVLARHWGW